MVPALELKRLSLAYGREPVLADISLEIAHGDLACLLGPSGCGKTTLLRAIAGFERPRSGEILIDGVCVASATQALAPEQRKVGMVFQDLALFPHLTVEQNIAFGLTHLPRTAQIERVDELLALTGLAPQRGHFPHKLSGGQQQRVALARAMAPRPNLLLLDEPFSSLDVELREQLAAEVRLILKKERVTTVLVSHNQLEAFALADRLGVLQAGRLQQWGDAYTLYHRPSNRIVAGFVGEGVLVPATVVGPGAVATELGRIEGRVGDEYGTGADVDVLLRPDDVIHDDSSATRAIVLDKAFRGSHFLYSLGLASGAQVLSLVPSHHDHAVGSRIGLRLAVNELVLFARPAV